MPTPVKLVEWVSNNLNSRCYSYLLLDLAQADKAYLKIRKWKLPYFSLFDKTPEQHLVNIAPMLIPLGNISLGALKELCEWAIDLACRAPCLSWIASQLPADELAAHLRKFHIVALSDNQTMMLRWYDTRILPVWFACLTSEQAAQFTTGISSIQYMNRFGVADNIPCSQLADSTLECAQVESPPLRLTDQQYAMLVDASETDMLVSHLRRVITDETNAIATQDLFKFVAKYQQRAIDSGIDDLDRQTQYLLLALYTSGKAIENPQFADFIQQPPRSVNDFYAGILALPESVWAAGPPLWKPIRG